MTAALPPGAADGTAPSARRTSLPSLADAAPWLARFTPPFQFGSFFAPEDTVLCALATRSRSAGRAGPGAPAVLDARCRVVELTAGSAHVLGAALLGEPGSRASCRGRPGGVERGHANLAAPGHRRPRAMRRVGLFSRRLPSWLRTRPARRGRCNPPYIPEPPDAPLARGRARARAATATRAASSARAGRGGRAARWCSRGAASATRGVSRTAARAGTGWSGCGWRRSPTASTRARCTTTCAPARRLPRRGR
jgi:hypothetical protein